MPNPISDLLLKRPTLVNWLHALGLVSPRTQTRPDELACLERHAQGRRLALEIGTFQGVSAAVIARAMAADGRLYCVDPWPLHRGRETPEFQIYKRLLKRSGVDGKVTYLQGTSKTMGDRFPQDLDFAFIDGDHSYDAVVLDWRAVRPRLAKGAVVCWHDTSVPRDAPERNFGSCRFFDEVVRTDPDFEHLETVYSLNAIRRRAQHTA